MCESYNRQYKRDYRSVMPTKTELVKLHEQHKLPLFNYAGDHRRSLVVWRQACAANLDGTLIDYQTLC